MSNRDDFSASVKRTLWERAAHLCSAPDCGRLTVYPSPSNTGEAVRLGTAAHIHGAAPGAARYAPEQTAEERSSIENGIWLCTECSYKVDKEKARFPAALLREWKATHEAAIAQVVPTKPIDVTATTLDGVLMPPEGNVTIEASLVAALRQHVVVLRNSTRESVRGLQVRVQFPELILDVNCKVPVGADYRATAARGEFIASVSGEGASVTMGRPRPLAIWDLEVSELLAGQEVRLVITSVLDPNSSRLGRGVPNVPESISAFLEGSFLIPYGQKLQVPREFLAEIQYDAARRSIAIGAVHAAHDAVPRFRLLFAW